MLAAQSVQPAWGQKVNHTDAAEARAAAVAAGRTSYSVKRACGAGQPLTFYINTGKVPVLIDRQLQPIEGPRFAARPSHVAYCEEVRHGSDVIVSVPIDAVDDWATEEEMPDECKADDCGWEAGPVQRSKPIFAGHEPGPADPSLNAASTEKEIMQRLLTDQVVDSIAQFGKQHAAWYREKKLGVYTAMDLSKCDDTVESSMDFECSTLNGEAVRLWIAAKLKVACLSSAVNESVLWDNTNSLYDKLLDRKMPYNCYQWFNRHMSFAEYNGDDEEQRYDRYRKRRHVTDLINQILPKTYHPHQDVGVDEKVDRICRAGTEPVLF